MSLTKAGEAALGGLQTAADRDIVDLDALPVGTVFFVHENDETAKLRLLHVEEAARGHGIGTRLVDECVRKARECGYKRGPTTC